LEIQQHNQSSTKTPASIFVLSPKMQEEEEEGRVAHLRALAVVAEAWEEEAAVVVGVGVVDKD
jgi:phenylacetate-coenzyme A ligase PaaK-like adenylate-forming protein